MCEIDTYLYVVISKENAVVQSVYKIRDLKI